MSVLSSFQQSIYTIASQVTSYQEAFSVNLPEEPVQYHLLLVECMTHITSQQEGACSNVSYFILKTHCED